MQGAWQLTTDFLLRSAGFPLTLLEELRFSRTANLINQLLDAEQTLGALQKRLHSLRAEKLQNPEDIARWKRIRHRAVKGFTLAATDIAWVKENGGPVEELIVLNTALEHFHHLRATAQQVFEEELASKRQVLRRIAASPHFQEAVFLSSPHMFRYGLQPYLAEQPRERRAEHKRIERQLIAYLQRFTGKNETASFFGPINYGTFAAEGREDRESMADLELRLSTPFYRYQTTLQHRETFMAYWTVQALAERFSRLPTVYPYLTPIRNFRFQLLEDGTLYSSISLKQVHIQRLASRMLQLADGSHTLHQIAQELGTPLSLLQPVLHELIERHLLRLTWEVPVTEIRPLEWLMQEVSRISVEDEEVERWQRALQDLKHLKDSFSAAPLEEKTHLLAEAERLFQSLTGQSATREGGKMYADRSLFYEECRGYLDHLYLAPQVREAWERQLAPMLQLCAAHATELKKAQRKYALQIFQMLYGSATRPVPYLRFLTDAVRHPSWEHWSEQYAHMQTVVQQRLTSRVAGLMQGDQPREVTLSSADINLLVQDVPMEDKELYMCSPDIMLIPEREGEAQLVLGEIHDTVLLWGWALAFHPQEECVRTRMRQAVQDAAKNAPGPLLNILSTRRVKITPFEYPGVTIQVHAHSNSTQHERRALADLYVRPGHEELELFLAQGTEAQARVYNGELHSMAHDWFALPALRKVPVITGSYTPRIRVNGAIYQRQQWRLRREDAWQPRYNGTSFMLFSDMLRMQRRLNMPERVFVRVSGEVKPFMIDFHNFFLLELWESYMHADREALVSEMLPTPDQCWLTDPEGYNHVAEFRLAALYVCEPR